MINILVAIPNPQKQKDLEVKLNNAFSAVTICYRNTSLEVIEEFEKKSYDCILISPNEKGFDGLELAKQLRSMYQSVKIIFIADDEKYAVKAFKTRANGYLVNPTTNALKDEFNDLRIGLDVNVASCITFGNFDIYVNGKPVKFSKSKSKELLAFLVYKRGTSASSSELIVNLWEDKDVDRTTRSMLHNYLSDIRKTLNDYGISNIFSYERNSYRILKDNLKCDYFSFLDGDKKVINSYVDEFMSDYDWAVFTAAELTKMKNDFNRKGFI